jgi:hypothetical protein
MKLSDIDISKTLTPAELAALGFERVSRGDAIRAMCLQCMGGSPNEVRACVSGTCPLFVFRLGSDPWREKREMSDEQREAAVARLAKAREARA